jgi:small subunit ribosomal protein S1
LAKSKKSETTSSKESLPSTKASADAKAVADKTGGKQTPLTKPSKVVKGPMTMEELLSSTGYKITVLKRGQEITGKVLTVNRSEILVDIGAKSEGIVYGREIAANPDLLLSLTPGDSIEATVIYPENEQGQVVLSLRKHSGDKRWNELEERRDSGETIEVAAVEVNRGGIICEYFGLRGFLPASQLSQMPSSMGDLIGKKLTVSVIEVDRPSNRLIFTQKQQGTKDIEQVRKQLANIKVGEKYKGVITAILPFGIFVEIDLGERQAKKDSIASLQNDKGEGQERKDSGYIEPYGPRPSDSGPKARMTDADESKGKIEGLVHLSEINWEKTEDPTKGFAVGQEIEVVVASKDEEAGRLNLSIKQLGEDPLSKILEQFTVGQKVTGKVSKVTPYGVFVEISVGGKGDKVSKGDKGEIKIDGLMHISKIPPTLGLKVGDTVECEVENVDTATRKVALVPVVKEKPVLYR